MNTCICRICWKKVLVGYEEEHLKSEHPIIWEQIEDDRLYKIRSYLGSVPNRGKKNPSEWRA